MNVDISKAMRLMKVVELQGVRLIEAHSKSNMAASEEIGGVVAEFNFGGGALAQVEPELLIVHARIEIFVRPVEPAETAERLVTMETTFELQYSIPANTAPSQEEL